jgi:hypothetical protein
VTVNVSLPAGTFITQNCCDPVAPDRLLTGTPSVSVAGPTVTVTDADAVCDVVLDVPVTENVVVLAVAAALAEIVSVAEAPAVTVAGENEPLTPPGSPETLSAIDCVLPLIALVVTEYEVELPAATDAEPGDTATAKSAGGGGVCVLTVTATVVVCVADEPVPVTVNVYVPTAAVPALNVSVEPPPAVTDAGENEAVALAGTPLTLRFTVWAAPLATAVVIVIGAELPWATVSDAGFAAIEKSLLAAAPQPGNLNDAIRVFQLNVPLAGMYSLAYQNVQSSTGSIWSDE